MHVGPGEGTGLSAYARRAGNVTGPAEVTVAADRKNNTKIINHPGNAYL